MHRSTHLALLLFAPLAQAADIAYSAASIPFSPYEYLLNDRGWMATHFRSSPPSRFRPGVGWEQITVHAGEFTDINQMGTLVGYWIGRGGIIRPPGEPWRYIGDKTTVPYSINNSGQVAGGFTLPTGESAPFLWTESSGVVNLGGLPGYPHGFARAVNDSGTVLGTSYKASGEQRGFLWTETNGLVDLTALAGSGFIGYVLSNNGSIGGVMDSGHTAIYHPSTGLRKLGRGGPPKAINDRGWMVGGYGEPWLYVYGQGLINLKEIGAPADVFDVRDFNNRDQIILRGHEKSYLLTRIR